MKVYVKLFANLAQSVPRAVLSRPPQGIRPGIPLEVELTEGSVLADLATCLALPGEKMRLIFVNGRARKLDYTLAPGDKVGIFPPIGGG